MYGGVGLPLIELPHGSPSVHLHPALNLSVSLSLDGAHFDGPDWKLHIPHPPALTLASPKLLQGEGLQLLRDIDGEIGISFDKHSSRHFFFWGKAPTTPKFVLNLQVWALLLFPLFPTTMTEFNCRLMGPRTSNSTKRKGYCP
jgi:hypothetical protein